MLIIWRSIERLGARGTEVTFSGKIFYFKSAWIFACAFQFTRKTFSCIFFWLKCSCSALLRSVIVHASIFCLCFSQKQSANQPRKLQGNGLLLNWKAHVKIQALLKEKKLPKSHFRPSCTKPFNYVHNNNNNNNNNNDFIYTSVKAFVARS